MLQPNFNPRSHEGSDDYSLVFAGDYGISIRAPTRGATCNPRNNGILVDFNPRSHEGSDDGSIIYDTVCGISIRAPTRGATEFTGNVTDYYVFQSALPRGERLDSTVALTTGE